MTLSLWYVPTLSFADCSVCSKNYVSSRRFVCRQCSNRTTSIAIATVVSFLVAAMGLYLFSYLVSSRKEGTGRGVIDRITQRIPKQSVKIIIVVWQILTQVRVSDEHKLVGLGFRWRWSWLLAAHHEPKGLHSRKLAKYSEHFFEQAMSQRSHDIGTDSPLSKR